MLHDVIMLIYPWTIYLKLQRSPYFKLITYRLVKITVQQFWAQFPYAGMIMLNEKYPYFL